MKFRASVECMLFKCFSLCCIYSASLTLTYAYDDFVLAQISLLVGDTQSADAATARAQNYRNIWSSELEFMCPRSHDGELQCSKSATSLDSWQNYVEGEYMLLFAIETWNQ